jgi:hypothetical protein
VRIVRARSTGLVLGLAVVAAVILTATGTRLAASQETVLTALQTDEQVPVREPWDEFWDGLQKVDVALSAQAATAPMGGRGFTMTARAVHDGTNLYILVEWQDPSAERSVGRTQDFSDAVAVQFPGVAGSQVPAFCMGDPTATVNIWQWRAAWQADVAQGYQGNVQDQYPNAAVDEYPFEEDPVFYPGRAVDNPVSVTDRRTPVDNLVAASFGSLTADPEVSVDGWGEWRDGTWRVVFTRPLSVGTEGNVELYPDTYADVAFAVWDGAADERNGMKSVANFIALDTETEPLTEPSGFPQWPLLVVFGLWVLFAIMIVVDLPRSR